MRYATQSTRPVNVSHTGAKFHETITVQTANGPVNLTWMQGREITRWVESIALARRARENFRRARLQRQAEEKLKEIGLTLPEGRAVKDYYVARFYDPKIPMRCHW